MKREDSFGKKNGLLQYLLKRKIIMERVGILKDLLSKPALLFLYAMLM